MKFSARNTLAGNTDQMAKRAVNTELSVTLGRGAEVVASITRPSAYAVELRAGGSMSGILTTINVRVGV
jgi:molybdopterin-binding protein